MSTYRLIESAAIELADAVAFYEDDASRLGSTFLDEFDRAIDLILEMREAWSHFARAWQLWNMPPPRVVELM